jgi:hypothetical protein
MDGVFIQILLVICTGLLSALVWVIKEYVAKTQSSIDKVIDQTTEFSKAILHITNRQDSLEKQVELIAQSGYRRQNKRQLTTCILALLMLTFTACRTRYATQTITIRDTVVTQAVKLDTVVVLKPVLTHSNDTIVLHKANYYTRIIRTHDTLQLSGGCNADTIYINKNVQVPVYISKDKPPTLFGNISWKLLFIGILLIALLALLLQFIQLFKIK